MLERLEIIVYDPAMSGDKQRTLLRWQKRACRNQTKNLSCRKDSDILWLQKSRKPKWIMRENSWLELITRNDLIGTSETPHWVLILNNVGIIPKTYKSVQNDPLQV